MCPSSSIRTCLSRVICAQRSTARPPRQPNSRAVPGAYASRRAVRLERGSAGQVVERSLDEPAGPPGDLPSWEQLHRAAGAFNRPGTPRSLARAGLYCRHQRCRPRLRGSPSLSPRLLGSRLSWERIAEWSWLPISTGPGVAAGLAGLGVLTLAFQQLHDLALADVHERSFPSEACLGLLPRLARCRSACAYPRRRRGRALP